MRAPAAGAGWLRGAGIALALGLGVGASARGEGAPPEAEEAPAPAAEPGSPAPGQAPVGLDRLLKLPAGSAYGAADERRGGRTRGQWAQRFAGLRSALAYEKHGLEAAQGERDRIAGSSDQWLLGPPGATRENAPLDFRLRQEIGHHRDEIERLEQDLRELEVEADLADVPPAWRE